MNKMNHRFPRRAAVACALALLLAAAIPAAAAAAEGKPFAVIDSERIVKEYGAAKDAQEQYQNFASELNRDLDDRVREVLQMEEEINSQKMLLGEDALAARLEELENLRADYFEFKNGIEAKLEAEYNAKIKPIIDQVTTIAERIGKEEGWGIIIDSASLTSIYVDPDIDLTDKVLQALVSGGD